MFAIKPSQCLSKNTEYSPPRWPCSTSLQWRYNEGVGVSNHRRPDCLHNRLFTRSKKTSKLRITGFSEGNPLVTGGFPSQRASNAEDVFIWWRHHVNTHGASKCLLLFISQFINGTAISIVYFHIINDTSIFCCLLSMSSMALRCFVVWLIKAEWRIYASVN